jgi:hypothetical protein
MPGRFLHYCHACGGMCINIYVIHHV